ncbi:hypothetical protein BDV29DRAFT_174956 [Aspergillus leporis]|uniref:Uncharacterized protein n=1 Tax=Aspergillus leporis TaxID=41062 RepID=A0A5N5WYS7_9EURO|nr:hypothetical protein BDV29DRAFT_174956 [Aspergillus leporis]
MPQKGNQSILDYHPGHASMIMLSCFALTNSKMPAVALRLHQSRKRGSDICDLLGYMVMQMASAPVAWGSSLFPMWVATNSQPMFLSIERWRSR